MVGCFLRHMVQNWATRDFILLESREIKDIAIPTDLEGTKVLRFPHNGRHLLAVKASSFGMYISTEVWTIHNCYIAELDMLTGTIRMIAEAKNSVDDRHSEEDEEDRIDRIAWRKLILVVNLLPKYVTQYKHKMMSLFKQQ